MDPWITLFSPRGPAGVTGEERGEKEKEEQGRKKGKGEEKEEK